jgi:hypothetical protein
MPEFYNRFPGQNTERLTALSDGLCAVAMTTSTCTASENRLTSVA